MIPKKIHYCWFGGNPLPKSAIKCINSWKRNFPDYEIIEWNEKNFDVTFNKYAYDAYKNKKFAFFTDVARLYIIQKYGGIYFDIDVEVIKPYADIINNCSAFFGIEEKGSVNTGLGFGAKKNNEFVKMLLDDYNSQKFYNQDGSINLTACTTINSKIFKQYGFKLDNSYEEINNIKVLPKDFFNTLDNATGRVIITKNSHSIHRYKATWLPISKRIKIILLRPLRLALGDKYYKIKNIISNKK